VLGQLDPVALIGRVTTRVIARNRAYDTRPKVYRSVSSGKSRRRRATRTFSRAVVRQGRDIKTHPPTAGGEHTKADVTLVSPAQNVEVEVSSYSCEAVVEGDDGCGG
jgi:hypothetical protein